MSKHVTTSSRRAFRRHAWSTTRSVFISIIGVLTIVAATGLAPSTHTEQLAVPVGPVQSFTSATSTEIAPTVVRHDFSATAGYATYIRGGTNYDWARLVLLMGGFPISESNVTVVTRWMRQENFVDTWYTRNNPLNNGWGSGGGGGTGSYVNLVDAAQNAAEALNTLPRYSEIVATLQASAPTDEVERAIWFSGWATGMYNNGAHWAYNEVPVVTAPPSAWGQ